MNSDVDDQWNNNKQAMHLPAGFACGPKSFVSQGHWMSHESLSLMKKVSSPDVK